MFYKHRDQKVLIPADPALSEDELFGDGEDEDPPDHMPHNMTQTPQAPAVCPTKTTYNTYSTTATVFGDDEDDDEGDGDDDADEKVQEEDQQKSGKRKGSDKGTGKRQNSEFQTRPKPWNTENPSSPSMPQCVHQPRLFVEGLYLYFS